MKESRHANFGAIQAIFLQMELSIETNISSEVSVNLVTPSLAVAELFQNYFTSNGRHPALSKVISDLDLLLLTLDTKASV